MLFSFNAGREFQCVFLSTAEPTTAEGASENPTKTPCSQYVFNTALTRAKSLVVCAGSPFLLMKIEKQMNNVDKRPFWAEYIRRCMENETFIIPDSLRLSPVDRRKKLDKLRELVFKAGTQTSFSLSAERKLDTMDSITEAYKKAFKELPNLQRCRVQLKSSMGSTLWQMKEDGDDSAGKQKSSSKQIEVIERVLRCRLKVVSSRKALGYPIDLKKSVVTLNGLKNRKGAFDGDIVDIELYESAGESDKAYGTVIRIVQKCHQERHICRADRYSTIHFNPIDKKTPTFVNLPRISRDLLRYRKEDIEAGLSSQNQWVVVFEEDSLPLSGEDELPKIKEVISADSASNHLFVVKEIGWDKKYRLPLGAVVESLPLGSNVFNSEYILRAAYGVNENELDKKASGEKDDREVKTMLPLLPPTAASDVVRQAFTIGPPNVTHALSIVHDRGGTYTMSVLVPNVASQLKQDSPDDNRARACANTLRNGFVYNMLPAAVRQQLNLSQRRICGVFIVSTKVMVQQDGIVHVVSDPVITLGKVQSQVQLDYLEAQCLIDQVPTSDSLKLKLVEYPSFTNQPDLPKSLLLLYKIAMHFRVNRLGQMGYAFEITQEVKNSWQAHLLVEELMMWANASVAEYVCKQMPKLAVLQKQVSPREEDVKGFLDKYGGVIEHSVALRNRKLQKSASKKLEPLLIPSSTLLQLHEAVQNEDAFYLQHLLTSDYLYPQLAAAKAHLKDIEEEAEYVCGQIDSSSKSGSTFCHYGQNLKLYTHFTSPTERFCDVVVQRILLSILNKTECTYNVEELENLCRHLNIRSREAKLFQREVKQVKLAEQFGESCEETNAYVYKDEHRFVVSFPDLRYQSFLKKVEFHIQSP